MASRSPATAATPVGVPGTSDVTSPGGPSGVTAGDGDEGGLEPMALMAVTVNVWAMSLVRSVTVHESAPAVVQVAPPGAAVAV